MRGSSCQLLLMVFFYYIVIEHRGEIRIIKRNSLSIKGHKCILVVSHITSSIFKSKTCVLFVSHHTNLKGQYLVMLNIAETQLLY